MERGTKKKLSDLETPTALNKQFTPDESIPLVYHMHGDANHPPSMVLTHRDYLDFVTYLSKEIDTRLPSVIRRALSGTIYLSGHNYTSDTSSLIVMNGTTNKMISESLFRSAEFPNLYPNPKTNMIYLVSSFSDYESELIAFNGTTNKVMEHIELKKSPSDVSFDPMNNAIYVLSADYDEIPPSNYITAIDGTTNKIIKDFPLYGIADLRAIDVNPDTSMIYLLSSSSESMSAINGTQLLAER